MQAQRIPITTTPCGVQAVNIRVEAPSRPATRTFVVDPFTEECCVCLRDKSTTAMKDFVCADCQSAAL